MPLREPQAGLDHAGAFVRAAKIRQRGALGHEDVRDETHEISSLRSSESAIGDRDGTRGLLLEHVAASELSKEGHVRRIRPQVGQLFRGRLQDGQGGRVPICL